MRSILYVYVTNAEGIFKGTVSLRRLLVADPNQKLRDLLKISRKVSTLKPDFSMDEIMEVMTRYNLYSAAVLDNKRHLVGVVTIDDIMRQLKPYA